MTPWPSRSSTCSSCWRRRAPARSRWRATSTSGTRGTCSRTPTPTASGRDESRSARACTSTCSWSTVRSGSPIRERSAGPTMASATATRCSPWRLRAPRKGSVRRYGRVRLAMTFGLGALALGYAPARAQEGAIVLEGGAVRALPAGALSDATATYGVGGLRVEWTSPGATLIAGGYGGQTTGDAASDFFSGVVGADLWLFPGRPVDVGVGALLQGFEVREPLLHRVTSGEVTPMLRLGNGAVQLVARGR